MYSVIPFKGTIQEIHKQANDYSSTTLIHGWRGILAMLWQAYTWNLAKSYEVTICVESEHTTGPRGLLLWVKVSVCEIQAPPGAGKEGTPDGQAVHRDS